MADVDRLSNLPDEILTHILSFMSTKEAIQTSLLAKRYRNLWASVPVLQFDFRDFLPPEEILKQLLVDDDDLNQYEEKLVNFVNGVFEHHEPLNLDAFKLMWTNDNGDTTPAATWLDNVAKLKPKFLSIHICSYSSDFEVPDCVFTCESLKELVLYLRSDAINPSSVNLPSLKRLTLDTVPIEDEVMQKLLSGMPALEEMVLEDCELYSSVISSGTLKRLVLCDNEINPPEILISIPSLMFLEVRSRPMQMGKYKFKKLEFLVRAQIDLKWLSDVEPSFLTALSNVTSLELVLSVSFLKDMNDALARGITKFPTFDNLKTLKIGKWCMTGDFYLVAHFLRHAPDLQKLTLLHCEPLTGSSIEINVLLGDCLDIVETTDQKNNKSATELVNCVKTHFEIIRRPNIISLV